MMIDRGPVSQLQLTSRSVLLFDRFSGLAEYRTRDAGMVTHRERLPEFTASGSVDARQSTG
jgi:hypothetical protein